MVAVVVDHGHTGRLASHLETPVNSPEAVERRPDIVSRDVETDSDGDRRRAFRRCELPAHAA